MQIGTCKVETRALLSVRGKLHCANCMLRNGVRSQAAHMHSEWHILMCKLPANKWFAVARCAHAF